MKIKKILFVVVCIVMAQPAVLAQKKYKLSNAEISFFSEAPMENIEAINKTTAGIIDPATNKFTFRAKIKDFVFNSSLMQDHFNENYLESEKYPNSTFKGVIIGDYDLEKGGLYTVIAKGEFTIHGVTKPVEIKTSITVKNGTVSISSEFKVTLEDYKIEIPSLMFQKIAEVIDIKVDSKLESF
ncbi:MAG: YceI family protein [Flavobacteriales bacterium]|nr:YceI family protein [Flavobacteriales bacterium]